MRARRHAVGEVVALAHELLSRCRA
jgi:hypothetical protein